MEIFIFKFVHRCRMELGEIGWEGVDWMHLSQDRYQWYTLVNMVMSLQVS
jgi:hypothetical protein